MATAELTVTANLAGLKQQLDSIKDISGDAATQMVRQLDRSIRASEKASKQAAAATKKAMDDAKKSAAAAAAAASDVSDKFGKLGSAAGKVAGVLDLVVPGLGQFAVGINDVADGMEVATAAGTLTTASIGALVSILAAAGAAFAIYNDSQREAADLAKIHADTLKIQIEGAQRLRDIDLELEVAQGLVSQGQAELTRIYAENADKRDELIESIGREIAANEQAIQSNEQLKGTLGFVSFGLVESAQAMGFFGEQTSTLTRKNAALRAQLEAGISTTDREADALAEVAKQRQADTEARDRAAEADRRAAAAAKAKADADRAAAEAERAKEQAARSYLDAVSGYADGIRSLQAAQLATATEEEKILAAGEERLRQLAELTQRTQYLALTSEEAARAEAEGARAAAAIREETAAKLDALEQAAHEKRLARLDEERTKREEEEAALAEAQAAAIENGVALVSEALASSADNQADILGKLEAQLAAGEDTMTASQKEALKERIAAQRQAAMQAFSVNKAAKLAEATVNTAAAITQALASAPPPFNLLNAGIAGAAGAVQVAAIASQQPAFHSGGMVPDEVPARLVAGEAVLSRVGRNVIGDEQIRAANAGMQPMERPLVVVQQYRHRIYNDFIRNDLRLGGNLASAIRGSRVVGMREAL